LLWGFCFGVFALEAFALGAFALRLLFLAFGVEGFWQGKELLKGKCWREIAEEKKNC
jgi:hypothetical protein